MLQKTEANIKINIKILNAMLCEAVLNLFNTVTSIIYVYTNTIFKYYKSASNFLS